MGDMKLLRYFCDINVSQESTLNKLEHATQSQFPTRNGKKRRQELLQLVRTGRGVSAASESTDDHRHPGRPKGASRKVNFGLRILKSGDEHFQSHRTALTVQCPLGDCNLIQVKLLVDADYDSALNKVVSKLFPDNVNPVIGNKSNFMTMELVNCLNQNIKHIKLPFTLSNYIEEKMISGSVRLNLLCIPSGLNSLDDSDSDDLPDILEEGKLKELTPADVDAQLVNTSDNQICSQPPDDVLVSTQCEGTCDIQEEILTYEIYYLLLHPSHLSFLIYIFRDIRTTSIL